MSQDLNLHVRRAFDQWSVASASRRVASFTIDSLMVAILLIVGLLISKGRLEWPGHFFLWIVGMWIWEAFFISWRGQTPGNSLLKIRLHAPRYDGSPRSLQLTLRILNFWCGLSLIGIGLSSILSRRDRRGWHDLLAETVVLGPKREVPAPIVQQIGQSLSLLQALTVFSALGAVFVTVGFGHSRIEYVSQDDSSPKTCNIADLLLHQPEKTLFALAVSPAYAHCWDQKHDSLAILQDSEIYKVAHMSRYYFDIWNVEPRARVGIYSQLIKSQEDSLCMLEETRGSCRAPRSIASEVDSVVQTWSSLHRRFLSKLAAANSPSERIVLLKTEAAQTSDAFILQALSDRIWSEELASGRRPSSKQPTSSDDAWNQDQLCWLRALDFENTPGCAAHPINRGMETVRTLDVNDVTLAEAEYYLAELRNEELPKEFDRIGRLWKAVKKKNSAEAKALWEGFPQTSPLYSYAQKWYAQLK